jgi:hypothetical protein
MGTVRKMMGFFPREPNKREENFGLFPSWFLKCNCFTDFRCAELVIYNNEASNQSKMNMEFSYSQALLCGKGNSFRKNNNEGTPQKPLSISNAKTRSPERSRESVLRFGVVFVCLRVEFDAMDES